MNIENELWLDRLPAPARKSPNKCGHCRQEGHTQPNCPGVEILAEQLYTVCLGHLQNDLHGYLFEKYVFSLLVRDLKILYKKVCGKMMRTKKEGSVYEDIFNTFAALNIGYVGKRYRSEYLYSTAYRAIQNDVARNRHGYHFQKFLLQLSVFQLKELFEKVNRGVGNWVGRATSDREMVGFGEYRRSHRLMTTEHFFIHCHFAEIDIGYNFSMQDYCANLPQNNKPFNEAFISNGNSEILMTRKVQGNTVFMKSISLEKVDVEGESEMDCAVCYDSCSVQQFVKTGCSHDFCGPCFGTIIGKSLENRTDTLCPMCRTSVRSLTYCHEDILEKMREKIVV
jgi:hypothetical protein